MAAKTVVVSLYPPFVPVLKELRRRGWEVVTLNDRFGEHLQGHEIPYSTLRTYVGGQTDLAFEWAGAVIQALPEVLAGLNGAHPAAVGWLRDKAVPFYYPRLADLALVVTALENLRPDLFLLHNDVEALTRGVALWARAKAVPCLHSPHAVYQAVNRTVLGTDIHDLVTASHLAVAGPFQRAWYVTCGADPANVRETGLPKFDSHAVREVRPRDVARRLLGLEPDGPPVVAWAASWGQRTGLKQARDVGEVELAYFAFLEAALKLGVRVIIKCHPHVPADNWDWQARQARAAGLDAVVTPSHLDVVIDACDLFLAYEASNTILEASFNPGVRLATTGGYDGDEAVRRVPPLDPDGMAGAIAAILADEPRPSGKLKAKYLGETDGKAWLRVADYCEEIVGGMRL